MALNMFKHGLIMLLASFVLAQAGDPDITSDFLSFTPNQTVNAKFFTHTGLRGLPGAPPPATFTITKATHAEFPGLNGQGVSYSYLQFPANSINPVHTHPRAAELLFVLLGCLEVGLIDTKNNLYTQTLQKGNMFVFQKGLVHYQLNPHMKYPAAAISAFGSANAGTVSLPTALFSTGIRNDALTKSVSRKGLQGPNKVFKGDLYSLLNYNPIAKCSNRHFAIMELQNKYRIA